MALTLADVGEAKNRPQGVGQRLERVVDVTWDANYVTGGLTLAAATAGLRRITGVDVLGERSAGAAGKSVGADLTPTDGSVKLKLYSGALAEVANASNQSGVTFRLNVIGY